MEIWRGFVHGFGGWDLGFGSGGAGWGAVVGKARSERRTERRVG
jgi:hypothetical protein